MNTYNEIATLIQPCVASDGTETETATQIFVAVTSVGYNEFYQATQNGFAPELKFTIADSRDYDMQPIIEFHERRYHIIRTYLVGASELELTCERVNIDGTV